MMSWGNESPRSIDVVAGCASGAQSPGTHNQRRRPGSGLACLVGDSLAWVRQEGASAWPFTKQCGVPVLHGRRPSSRWVFILSCWILAMLLSCVGRAPLMLVPIPLTSRGPLALCDGSKRQTTVAPPVLIWSMWYSHPASPPRIVTPSCFPLPHREAFRVHFFIPSNCLCVNLLPMAARPYVARALQLNSFASLDLLGENGKDKLL